ncbi:MAG: hypothetical protein JW940_32795 [Polyangiaceae bacterium]|nr:hypothetical protein [Polyangiaceae bacterium]
MRRLLGLLLLGSTMAHGCSNGQTGSLAYYCRDSECVSHALDWLESLDPSHAWAPVFVGSECHQYCKCLADDGGYEIVAPTGSPCAYRGRGGFCILPDSEVSLCDPSEPNSCQATCADLENRLAQDAMKVFDASVRFAACVTPEGWTSGSTGAGSCRMVAVINGACYTNDDPGGFFTDTPHDCSLTDQQIVLATYP